MEDDQKVGQIFDALRDAMRRRICLLLAEKGPQDVLQLCAALQISQPAMSHHLQLLRLTGLVDFERRERHNYYHLIKHDGLLLAIKLFEQIEAAPEPYQPPPSNGIRLKGKGSTASRKIRLYERYLAYNQDMADDDKHPLETMTPEEFDRWFNSLPQVQQKLWQDRYEKGYAIVKQELALKRAILKRK